MEDMPGSRLFIADGRVRALNEKAYHHIDDTGQQRNGC